MHKSESASSNRSGSWFLVFGLAVVAAFALRTLARSDLWMHLATGRWILAHGIPHTDVFSFATRPDQPWINNSWLYDVMVYGLWQAGGAPLVVLVHAVAAVSAFLLLIPVARKWSGTVGMTWGLALCGWLLAPSLDATPTTFCLFFPALFLLLLESGASAPRVAFVLIPAQMLWANCSESFVLGPLLTALYAVEARSVARRTPASGDAAAPRDWLPLAMLAAALALSSLANPFGRELWQYVAHSAADVRFHPLIEWSLFNAHFVWEPWKHLLTTTLVLFAAGFVSFRGRLPLALTVTAVACAFVMVRSSHFMETCIILSFPFICLSVSAIGNLVASEINRPLPACSRVWPAASLAIALAVTLVSVAAGVSNYFYNRSGSAAAFGWSVQRDLFPSEQALRALDALGTNRVIEIPVDGDYLAWQRPDRQLFADSRSPLYGANFYQQMQKALLGDTNAWDSVVEKWQPSGVVLNCTWPGASVAVRQLLLSGHWRLAYFDGLMAVLAEPVSENRALITDTKLQQAGLLSLEEANKAYRSRVRAERFPPNPAPLIGAAFVLQSMNRIEEAESVFDVLVRGAPTMIVGYVNRGICLVQLGRFEEAVSVLGQAAQSMPRDLYVWVWLSKAYRGAGRSADAEHAESVARSINARLADRLLTATPDAAAASTARQPQVSAAFPQEEARDATKAPAPASGQ